MNTLLRTAFIAIGLLALLLALALLLQQPWAGQLWPWPGGRLSRIFVASIFASAGLPVLWIGLTGEGAAVAAGAVNFAVMYGGMALFAWQVQVLDATRRAAGFFALACAVLALVCVLLWRWARRLPFSSMRPAPRSVRLSFMGFCVVLLLTGGALLLRMPNVFPWRLSPEESALYGCIFIGAACYFLHGVLMPLWKNTQGPLLGFLAYDLVLIAPFAAHFGKVDPALRMSLVVYTAVIVCSAALALYHLLLNPQTRMWQKAR
jgi:hypothetical protein